MERLSSLLLQQPDLTDENVVGRILNGEKALFEILMLRYNQRLFRVIRGYLNDKEEARDVTQNTYLKAYENLASFRGGSSFSTWLIKIGINEALMRLRKLKRKLEYASSLKNDDDSSTSYLNTGTMNPEQKAIQHETRQLIEQAVDNLPEKYRIVYVLREVEGIGIEEAAATLGISESNVKVRLFRAKELLQKNLVTLSEDVSIYEFGGNRCDLLREEVMKKILAGY